MVRKKIIIFIVLCAIVSLPAMQITFKCANNKDLHEYVICNNYYKTVRNGPFEYKVGRKKSHSLCADNKRGTNEFVLDASEDDVIQIFAYIHQKPYLGAYNLTLLKKISGDQLVDGQQILLDNLNIEHQTFSCRQFVDN